MNSAFKRYEMHGPSSVMATMAPNIRKAWSNLRFRLVRECGLSWYRAREYDRRDLHEVRGKWA